MARRFAPLLLASAVHAAILAPAAGGVWARAIAASVLSTGAQPNTTGITVNGLPPQAKARIVPSAPKAPSDPAPRLQGMPLMPQLPVSPIGTQRRHTTAVHRGLLEHVEHRRRLIEPG